MSRFADIGAAVIGTGFIGTVHVEALRRIGVRSAACSAARPERGAARADALGVRVRVRRRSTTSWPTTASTSSMSRRPTTSTSPQAPAILARRQARRLREAAGDDRGGVRRARRAAAAGRARQRRELQHPLLPAEPARARARRRRRARRGPARHRPLLPGLAAPRHRLELAAAAGPRRRAARGRRHRLALAGPDDVRDRPARHRGHGRPGDVRRDAPRSRPDPVETFSTDRSADTVARADRDRGHRHDPPPLRERRPRRGRRLADQRRAGRTRSSTRSTAPSRPPAWDSEQPDQLWIGHRDAAERDPASATRR